MVNAEPGTVPFAITFDQSNHLVVSESSGALATFALNWNGTVSQLDTVPSGQVVTCWVA